MEHVVAPAGRPAFNLLDHRDDRVQTLTAGAFQRRFLGHAVLGFVPASRRFRFGVGQTFVPVALFPITGSKRQRRQRRTHGSRNERRRRVLSNSRRNMPQHTFVNLAPSCSRCASSSPHDAHLEPRRRPKKERFPNEAGAFHPGSPPLLATLFYFPLIYMYREDSLPRKGQYKDFFAAFRWAHC